MPHPDRDDILVTDGDLWQFLAENLTDSAVFAIDLLGQIRHWHPTARRLFQYADDAILGQSVEVLASQEFVKSGLLEQTLASAASAGTDQVETWFIKQNRTPIWARATFTPLRNSQGTATGFNVVVRDRTEFKRTFEDQAAQLKAAERRQRLFDAALSNTPDLVYVFDLHHRFIYVNDGLLTMWGKSWDEAIGKNCLELGYEPWHAAMHDQEIEQVVATRKPIKGEVPFTGTFGRRHYEYIFVPVLGENGEVEAVAGTTRDVTEHRVAENSLREADRRKDELLATLQASEHFHRAIADLSTDYAFSGTVRSDGTATVDNVTGGFAKFYGASLDEMNERGGLAAAVHPEDFSVVERIIRKVSQGQSDRGVIRALTPDGRIKWQSYLVAPLKTSDNQDSITVYGACSDITAQYLLTEKLREKAESLSAILSATVDNIYLFDAEGRYRYVSEGGARNLGLRSEQMAGKSWRELGLPAETMTQFEAQRDEVYHTGVPQGYETTFVGADGINRYYEYTIAPVRNAEGQSAGVVVVSRDVTERKRSEQALREADITLRSFYETAPVMMGVVEVTRDDILHLTDNAATGRFFGMNPADLAGRRASELGISPEHRQRWLTHYHTSVRTGKPVRFEYSHETPEGTRWISAIVFCIERLDIDRYRCSYVAEDVTSQKVAEEALRIAERRWRDLAEALSEADRRKDEFLATLAHELRNPLAPIRNSLQILKLPRTDPKTAQMARDMIERQFQHLVRLVDDLLDVSRVMRGKIELRREMVDVAQIIGRAVEMAQPLIDSQGHVLTLTVPQEPLILDADPVRLAQVIGNLLINSAKFTEPQGRIWLEISRTDCEAVITVRDSGIGIDPNMLEHVFELFVQADHSSTKIQGGLGIGLTLVRNLTEMHGGTVSAFSHGLGRGCEFVVRLPLAIPINSEEALFNPIEGPSNIESGMKVLVVDDNRDAAISLSMLLSLQGHEVHVAHDGRAALERVKSFRPDLVFLDLGMPAMDGYEVAREIRKIPGLEAVRLAAITGWGQQEDRRRTTDAGFDHHLVKPPEIEAIEAVLNEVHQFLRNTNG